MGVRGTGGYDRRSLLDDPQRPGRCVLADALHTQRATAEKIGALGMHYILNVKSNQPTLLGQLRDDYRWSARELAVASCRHGRIEQRTIQVSEDLFDCPEWLDFPGVRRVFRILRETEYKKDGRQRRPETAYFVTSLPGPGSSAFHHANSPPDWGPDSRHDELRQVQSHRLRSIPPQSRSAKPLDGATESNFEIVWRKPGSTGIELPVRYNDPSVGTGEIRQHSPCTRKF